MTIDAIDICRYISGPCSFAHLMSQSSRKDIFLFGDDHMGTNNLCSPCKQPHCLTVDEFITRVARKNRTKGAFHLLLTEFINYSHPLYIIFGARVDETTLEVTNNIKNLSIRFCDARRSILRPLNQVSIKVSTTPLTLQEKETIISTCRRLCEIDFGEIFKLLFCSKTSQKALLKLNIDNIFDLGSKEFDSRGTHVFFKLYRRLGEIRKKSISKSS